MIGFPDETLHDFKQTIELNRKCLPDWMAVYIFYPYPGTELYSLCKKRGLLNNKLDERMERRRAVLNQKTFKKKQIQKQFEWFYYNVYKDKKPLFKTLGHVLITKIFSHPEINIVYRNLTSLPFFKKFETYFDDSK